jgi:hypothetical protein
MNDKDLLEDIELEADKQLAKLPFSKKACKRLSRELLGDGSSNGLLHEFVKWELSEGGNPILLEASFGMTKHKQGKVNVGDSLNIEIDDNFDKTDDGFGLESISFHGKIDRVESLYGRYHVIDYKSKTPGFLRSDKDPKRDWRPVQLVTYYMAMNELFKGHTTDLLPGGLYYYDLGKWDDHITSLSSIESHLKKIAFSPDLMRYLNRVVDPKWLLKSPKEIYPTIRTIDPLQVISELSLGSSHRTQPAKVEDVKRAIEAWVKGKGYQDIVEAIMDHVISDGKKTIFTHYKKLMEGDFKPIKSWGCNYCHYGNACNVASMGGDE